MKLSVSENIWQSREIDERLIYRYINNYNISDILARILISRNVAEIDVENFLDPKIKTLLPDPFHLKDMEKACRRAVDAVLNHNQITVFGDYDVDGATSSALLYKLFSAIGANCDIYIPDRTTEGYGPNISALQQFKNKGVNLVITVDCGITSFDAISFANSLDLDVIILDHHMSEVSMPSAYAIVNPNRLDETSAYKNLAAVGVCFLFAVGVIKILKEKNYFASKPLPNLLAMLDLVALGTVCDMMPLIGINRAFVIQGLKVMKQGSNLGIKILSEFGNVDTRTTAYHLGFVIGPRINAGGRVGKSDLGAKILSSNNFQDIYKYATDLEEYNETRKLLEQRITDEALIIAEDQKNADYIMLSNTCWHQGIIGIVAGRLKERYQKPVIAISVENGLGKASCRSVKGINMGQKIAQAKEEGIIISGGGHAMAAGFVVEESKIENLRQFLNIEISKDAALLEDSKTKYHDGIISTNTITTEFINEIEKLEPYGISNNEPIFMIEAVYVLKARIANNKHISCLLAPDKESVATRAIKAICFNCVGTNLSDTLLCEKPLRLNIIGSIKRNYWQGVSSVQVVISDIIVQ